MTVFDRPKVTQSGWHDVKTQLLTNDNVQSLMHHARALVSLPKALRPLHACQRLGRDRGRPKAGKAVCLNKYLLSQEICDGKRLPCVLWCMV